MDQPTPPRKRPQPKGGSRKGVPNRTTTAVKDAIMGAFHTVGGKTYLVMVAENDPRTFCALLGRVLPQELTATVTVDTDLARKLAEARERVKAGT